MFKLEASITVPEITPYEGGIFFLIIKFSKDCSFKPSRVKFVILIYYRNVGMESRCIRYKNKVNPLILLDIKNAIKKPNVGRYLNVDEL